MLMISDISRYRMTMMDLSSNENMTLVCPVYNIVSFVSKVTMIAFYNGEASSS